MKVRLNKRTIDEAVYKGPGGCYLWDNQQPGFGVSDLPELAASPSSSPTGSTVGDASTPSADTAGSRSIKPEKQLWRSS